MSSCGCLEEEMIVRKITALVLTLVLVLSLAVPNAAAVVTKSNDNVILVNSNTPQETEARSEVLMAGDVDGDGKVSVTDAMLTLRYAVRKIGDDALNTEIADANRDGSVSAADAMLILRFAVKKISELPPITRTGGTGMPEFLGGNFASKEYGKLKVCLNPTAPPFVLVETEDTTYLLGTNESAQTQAIYNALK